MNLLSSISGFFKNKKSKKKLSKYIKLLTGKTPKNIALYELSLKHVSSGKGKQQMMSDDNERLEFLGDALIGLIVAEFLFKKYPLKSEGFLTEMRSKMVNGESLGLLSKKIGIAEFVEFNNQNKTGHTHKTMCGDALEALIGAIYMDHGYEFCKKFVIKKLFEPHVDTAELAEKDENYKSKLLNWGQRIHKEVRFELIEVIDHKHHKEFVIVAKVDAQEKGIGKGTSKKKAEQDAARKALLNLAII